MKIQFALPALMLAAALGVAPPALAQASELDSLAPPDENSVSPVLRIERGPGRGERPRHPRKRADVRSIDGSGNNLRHPEMGAADTPLQRLVPADYEPGVCALAGGDRPSPRAISNEVNDQQESIPNPLGTSDYLWQWGQFLDHDIDLTDGVDPAERVDIAVPARDEWFDNPDDPGSAVIPFNRSIYDPASCTDVDNPRQQLNEISAWIDASNVYGSDHERAMWLRARDPQGRLNGRLKTSPGDLLPFNEDGLPNAGGDSSNFFFAGDVRANEQVGLTAMHTLFMREHNRLANEFAAAHPRWTGERIYQEARKIVGAQMQVITYHEFLPALLGPGALPPYRGYAPHTDASIANVFSAAIFRVGHTMLSPQILRLDSEGHEIEEGHLPLRHAFFAPSRLTDGGGIEPILRGLAYQRHQRVDPYVVDDVRNFLFGAPGEGGFDLASLNIQRGRDQGLPSYNKVRKAFRLRPAWGFADVSSDPEIQDRLESAYAAVGVHDIDVWIGGISEDPVVGAHVGPLVHRVIAWQFQALRDGDRFWYTRVLTPAQQHEVRRTRLADIIRRNTQIGDELPDNVFRARQPHQAGGH